MCNPVAIVMAVTAVAGAAQQNHMAKKEEGIANKQREKQDALARQQSNQRAAASNTTLFDVESENAGGSDAGLGNTFLTGSQGVSNDQLNLGGVQTKLGG